MNIEKIKKQIEKEIAYHDKRTMISKEVPALINYHTGYAEGLGRALALLDMAEEEFDKYCEKNNL